MNLQCNGYAFLVSKVKTTFIISKVNNDNNSFFVQISIKQKVGNDKSYNVLLWWKLLSPLMELRFCSLYVGMLGEGGVSRKNSQKSKFSSTRQAESLPKRKWETV